MSAPRMPTRAEILARLAASSKEQVTLEEMQRLGFWPADKTKPTLAEDTITRETQLQQTLNELHQELQVKGDPQAALAAMRKERMAQAKAKREETAQRHAQIRYERATRHFEAQKTSAGYLGEGLTPALRLPKGQEGAQGQEAASPTRAQPFPLNQAIDIAHAMGITLAELKFLGFHRDVSEVAHYRRFAIAKKTGGQRWISAPLPRLKRAQYWILDNILAKVACHPAAHGFMPGRSIVSNAQAHVGKSVVINLDLKDFFPSIKFPRIKGIFQHLGYCESVSTLLALLTSENVVDVMKVDGQQFYVGYPVRARQLPQGAPTSPMLTNILCRTLDKRLSGLAHKLGFSYTRYADDLTFSSSSRDQVGALLRRAKWIIADEGLELHPDKQHVMHAARQQTVTGIVVNQTLGATRQVRRRLRAALHQAARNQQEARAVWNGHLASAQTLLGVARFVTMVNPKQGARFVQAAQALGSTGKSHVKDLKAAMTSIIGKSADTSTRFRQAAAAGRAPTRPNEASWWQPAERAAPVLEKTAGQIKEERLQRMLQERRARDEASGRARPPREQNVQGESWQTAANAAQPDETPTPRVNKQAWGLFMIGISLLAFSFNSRSIALAGLALAAYAYFARQFRVRTAVTVVFAAILFERLFLR